MNALRTTVRLLVLTVAFLAFAAAALALAPTAGEHRLTTNATDQTEIAAYGDYVVYSDDRRGNYDVYLYNIETKVERLLTPSTYDESGPAIHGDRVVYSQYRNGHTYICLYDLRTNTARYLTGSAAEPRYPQIYGTKVVYDDNRNAGEEHQFDIYLFDLVTNTETRLTSRSISDMHPVIYQDKVAWADHEGDVFVRNLTTGTTKLLTPEDDEAGEVAIHDDKVVYTAWRYGNPDIFVYDLDTNTEKRLTTNSSGQYEPAIYGDRVVWYDERVGPGDSDIYMYNLETGTETRVTSAAGYQAKPAIRGTKVYYEDDRNGNIDVYLYELKKSATVKTPVADSTFYRDVPEKVYCYLKPRHTEGTYPVRFYLYKKISGAWVKQGYVKAKAYDYDSYTKCVKRVTFPSTGEWRIRACAPGDSKHATTWSSGYDYVTVKDVTVGTPDAPETMRDDTLYTVKGTLKPHHTEGTKPIRVYKWKKLADGSWDARGYSTATVYDYSTYSQYKKKMEFSSPGIWRLRALHPEDSRHRRCWSAGYDYVTVTN